MTKHEIHLTSKKEAFLIDSNSLISPFQEYYPFHLAPGFWECMKLAIFSRDVLLMDVVKDELLKGQKNAEKKDELTKWVESFDNNVILSRENEEIFAMYGKVLDYLETCGLYKEKASREWAKDDIADGWLIASACIGGHTIVTFEKPNKGLNLENPSKNAKIPDVCDHFSVKYVTRSSLLKILPTKNST